jgi:hypothetical protein
MMEAVSMRVLQLAKRSVLTVAAACAVLTGCGDSGPDVAFNPTGTTEDLEAVNATFGSSTFASFSTFGPMFDAALGGSSLISASAAAIDLRAKDGSGIRAAAARNAQRLAAALTSSGKIGLSASAASIPAELAGKTFVYSGGSYAVSDRAGAPANGVRFILYAVDPATFAPVEPLVETGYVELTDLSSGSSYAARVRVVSNGITYLNYTVTISSTSTGGRIVMLGFVTDGNHQANINLRATLTFDAGLTLTYSVGIPTRDFSINLTLTSSSDPESANIGINLVVLGPNGWIQMSGEFTQTGGTLTVSVSGRHFATITVSGSTPVITGADGQPLSEEDVAAMEGIFMITGEAFIGFDRLFIPVGAFLQPEA